jgi:hypothetical protein
MTKKMGVLQPGWILKLEGSYFAVLIICREAAYLNLTLHLIPRA